MISVRFLAGHDEGTEALIGQDPALLEALAAALDERARLILVTTPPGESGGAVLRGLAAMPHERFPLVIHVQEGEGRGVEGAHWLRVKSDLGLDVRACLRSAAMQAPDRVVVDRLADVPALEAALGVTLGGVQVLACVEGRDVQSSLALLAGCVDDPLRLGMALGAVVLHRRVRLLCAACARPSSEIRGLPLALRRELLSERRLLSARGCPECEQTGYRGRQDLLAVAFSDSGLGELLLGAARGGERPRGSADPSCLNPIRRDLAERAVRLVREGRTSAQELLRAVPEVEALE